MKLATIRLLAPCCVFFLVPSSGRTQTPSPQGSAPATGVVPTTDEIVARSIDAGGGKSAWMQITSMHQKGTVEISGNAAAGTFEKYDKAPNRSFESITLGSAVVTRGFDGSNGWKADPGQAAEDLKGDELEDAKLDADFYGAIRIKELYPSLVLKGESVADGRSCYAVVGTPVHGTPRTLYFEKNTGLLIGMSGVSTSGGKKSTFDSYFDDFKAVKGIQVPYTIRVKTQSSTVTMHVRVVDINAIIVNTAFSKPLNRPVASLPAASASPASSGPRLQARSGSGEIAENTFTSRDFGFSYTFPAGWTPHGQATNDELLNAGTRLVAGQDPVRRAALQSSIDRSTFLLTVFRYPLGTPGVSNESIIVIAERVDFAPGIQTGEDYLLNLRAGYRSAALPNVFAEGISHYTIGGKQFFRLDSQMRKPAGMVYEAMVSTKLRTHVLSFIFSTMNKDDLDGLVGSMNSVTFP